MNLPPNDIGNGAPIALVERIQGIKKQILPLCLMSLGTHIPLQHDMSETMSSIVSMEGQTIHGLSASGGFAWHFKIAAMSAIITSTSLSSMEETRMSGRLQSYFRFS